MEFFVKLVKRSVYMGGTVMVLNRLGSAIKGVDGAHNEEEMRRSLDDLKALEPVLERYVRKSKDLWELEGNARETFPKEMFTQLQRCLYFVMVYHGRLVVDSKDSSRSISEEKKKALEDSAWRLIQELTTHWLEGENAANRAMERARLHSAKGMSPLLLDAWMDIIEKTKASMVTVGTRLMAQRAYEEGALDRSQLEMWAQSIRDRLEKDRQERREKAEKKRNRSGSSDQAMKMKSGSFRFQWSLGLELGQLYYGVGQPDRAREEMEAVWKQVDRVEMANYLTKEVNNPWKGNDPSFCEWMRETVMPEWKAKGWIEKDEGVDHKSKGPWKR